jgi:hypothetical protein
MTHSSVYEGDGEQLSHLLLPYLQQILTFPFNSLFLSSIVSNFLNQRSPTENSHELLQNSASELLQNQNTFQLKDLVLIV